MKNIITFISFFLLSVTVFAQDIITLKDGTDIQAKVTAVNQSEISYLKYSNLDGPSYTLDISEILMITYENGEREVYNTSKGSLPSGAMTYNSWSGKVSVGGETIDNDLLPRYFAEDDLARFKTGRTLNTVGGIMSLAGAFPFGYGIGYILGWHLAGYGTPQGNYVRPYNSAKLMALIGGAFFVAGLGFSIPGESMIKTSINNYNSTLAYRPTLNIGATENGLGLVLVF